MSKAPKQPKQPKLCRHKATGHAYAKIDGKQVWFGPFDDPTTYEKFGRALAARVGGASGGIESAEAEEISSGMTVNGLADKYEVFVEQEGGDVDRAKHAIEPLRRMYGSTPAADFSPRKLDLVRQEWIGRQLARKTINERVNLIRKAFKWAVAREYIAESVWTRLEALEGTTRGATSKKRKPVDMADVLAVEPFVSRQVWALIRLQLLTGARPSELFGLRPCDIDRSDDDWCFRLDEHKTAEHDEERILWFNADARKVLCEFLPRAMDLPLFSPREAFAEMKAKEAEGSRRPGQKPTKRRTDRQIRLSYTKDSYCRAVTRACEKAGVPRWTPYRLRHTVATKLRKHASIDEAQAVLGHARRSTTERWYAELDRETKARNAVRKLG